MGLCVHSRNLRPHEMNPRLGKIARRGDYLSVQGRCKSCVQQKDKSHNDLIGIDQQCIKCSMERISALNAESQVGETRIQRGERKVENYLGTIPVSGKTPKTPEKSKK